jgi:hypothetical protein
MAKSASKGPPLFIIDAAKRLHRGLTTVQRKMAPPSAVLMEIASSGWRPRALGVVARLGIADLMASGPRDVADLAREAEVNEDALHRVLRALAHDGIFDMPAPRRFGLTSLSEPLRSDHASSMRHVVMMMDAGYRHESWSRIDESVKTGEPVFRKIHGRDLWSYFEDHPQDGRVFHRAMAEITRTVAPLCAAAYDFGRFTSIVDLGGGDGELIACLLKAHPSLRGVILDFEASMAEAPEVLRRAGVEDRCRLEVGNMFEGVPAGHDAYLMKNIVHGFADAELTPLFALLRQAMKAGTKLVLLEMLVPDEPGGVHPSFLDLEMLVGSGGRERSQGEYAALLAKNGFALEEVARTPSPIAVIVARFRG